MFDALLRLVALSAPPVAGARLEALAAVADALEDALPSAPMIARGLLVALIVAADAAWSDAARDDQEYDAWIGDGGASDDDDDDDSGDLIAITA